MTLTPLEWKVVTKADGNRSIDEIARALRTSAFDIAKTLYGLVTAELVEIGKARGAARAAAQVPAPAPLPAIPPPTGQSIPNVSTHSGVFQAALEGRREAQPSDPLHEGEAGGRGRSSGAGRRDDRPSSTARLSWSSTGAADSTSCAS